ncbi:hypothetical protein C2R22_10765 [Salinigranum rubrum]|uniref:Uncharacterized protein n=1 Tax=Salinigranum rubrum TaxID=755307 RepID=A0A2I8VJH5_9EURY|nr:hypothetical protein [Salinigranum rubrum]AUV82071.1 hypothetical protein C2R22_10765 [Salinigranum rubrum]
MALEEANTIYLPFVGEYEVESAMGMILLVAGLIGGATVWNMADGIGQNFATKVNSTLGSILGTNPATGQEEGADLL